MTFIKTSQWRLHSGKKLLRGHGLSRHGPAPCLGSLRRKIRSTLSKQDKQNNAHTSFRRGAGGKRDQGIENFQDIGREV